MKYERIRLEIKFGTVEQNVQCYLHALDNKDNNFLKND